MDDETSIPSHLFPFARGRMKEGHIPSNDDALALLRKVAPKKQTTVFLGREMVKLTRNSAGNIVSRQRDNVGGEGKKAPLSNCSISGVR
jgi:hypothetical protein